MKNQERKIKLDITGMSKDEIQNLMKLENYKPSMYYKIKKRGWMNVTSVKGKRKLMLEQISDECIKHFPLEVLQRTEKVELEKNDKLTAYLKDTRKNGLKKAIKITTYPLGKKNEDGFGYTVFVNGFLRNYETMKEALDYIQAVMANPHNKPKRKAKTKKESKKTVGRKKNEVGDVKIGKDGKTRVWTKLKSGRYDWRRVKQPKQKVELWYTDFMGRRQCQCFIDLATAKKRLKKHYAAPEAKAVIDVFDLDSNGNVIEDKMTSYTLADNGKWETI